MPRIDVTTWGTDVDTHTNRKNRMSFNMLTPESQGAGLDIVFQNSLQNSDYYLRKDPQNSISSEIDRQKSKVVFRYKDRRVMNNNMGFTAPTLKDIVNNVEESAANNYMEIINNQIDEEGFNRNIEKYFNITGMQQFDQNMGILFDSLKKHGVLLDDERKRIENLILQINILIIQDETIAQKVVQDPDLLQWLKNFIKYYTTFKEAFTKGKQALTILQAFIKKVMDYLRAMRTPVPREFEDFTSGGGGGGPPGGGGGGGADGRPGYSGSGGRPGPATGQGSGGGFPGGGGYGGGAGGSGPGTGGSGSGSGSGMSGSGMGGSGYSQGTTNSGHNVKNETPGGLSNPADTPMSWTEAGLEYARKMSQVDSSIDTGAIPQPQFTGQESTRPTEAEIDKVSDQPLQEATPPPSGLGDHDNMLYEAFAALLLSKSTYQALGLASMVGMSAVIANKLRNHMPGRFRENVLAVVGGAQPVYLMVQQLIHQGGSGLVNAIRRGFFGENVADVGEFMIDFIDRFMNAGLPRQEEIRRMREDPSPHIADNTNAVVRRIIDIINEINRDGVTQTRIDEFSDIKRLFASRSNRVGNYNQENAQVIDLAIQALNSQDLSKIDSVEWCRALLDIIFDNTKSTNFNGETQTRINRDFNEAHNKIKRFRQEVEQGTREGNPNTNLSRGILPSIEGALRDKNRQRLGEIVDKLKVQENTQLVQRAVDATDRELKGLGWINEFLQNLYEEGAIGSTKYEKLQQLIERN